MKKFKIVLAGNYQQFRQYLHESNSDPKTTIFANNPHKLYGIEADEIVRYGTYWKHPDRREIEEVAATRLR